MDHRKKEQTGIDGTVRKAAIRANFGKYHGTGAAVSLGTTLFDSLVPVKGAEIGQYGGCRLESGRFRKSNFLNAIIDDKPDGFLHRQWL
jgi:hypothetical protein